MTTLNKYELYCQTESARVYVWDTETPTVCPNNNGHTIDTNSIMITDTVSKTSTTIQAQNKTGTEFKDLLLDTEDNLKIHIANPLSSFGHISVEQPIPTIQLDGDYGFRPSDVITTAKGGCSVAAENNVFKVNSGTASGYADVQSVRRHKYRPGQGTLAMFTAMFEPGITGVKMLAGLTTEFSGIYFGYNGLDFGILHENGGMFDVHNLSIDNGVTSGNSTFTLTLNDEVHNIYITPDKSTSYNAWEVQEYFTSVTDWNAYQNENNVLIISDFSQTRTGTFSTTHGTFDQLKTGISKTKTWVKQTDWNFDKMDGTGPSGMIFNPLKGNVFKLQIQYLGYGNTKCFIEDENTGKFTLVHVLKWSNKNTSVVYTNPSFRPKISMSNDGNGTISRQIISPCMSVFNEGKIVYKRNPRSYSMTKVGIGTVYTNVLTIRNCAYFRNNINVTEVIPKFISISNVSAENSNTTIILMINHPFENYTNYQYVASDKSVMEYNIESNTVNSLDDLEILGIYNLGNQNSYTINFEDIEIEPYQTLSIFGKTNTNTCELSVSITWIED